MGRIRNLFLSSDSRKVLLFYSQGSAAKQVHKLAESSDTLNFTPTPKKLAIDGEKIDKCKNFRLSKLGGKFFLSYEKQGKVYGAISETMNHWKKTAALTSLKTAAVLAPDFSYDEDRVLYFADKKSVKLAYSVDLKKIRVLKTELLKTRAGKFDSEAIMPGAVFIRDEGLALVYYGIDKHKRFSLGVAFSTRIIRNSCYGALICRFGFRTTRKRSSRFP